MISSSHWLWTVFHCGLKGAGISGTRRSTSPNELMPPDTNIAANNVIISPRFMAPTAFVKRRSGFTTRASTKKRPNAITEICVAMR
jgi:hypothetical protein